MTIKRLPYGPLPDGFAAELRSLTVNATTGNFDSDDRLEIDGPFTGEIIGWVGKGTDKEVAEAFHRARSAQKIWAKTGYRERGKILLRFHDLLLKNRELLMDIIQLETGKSRNSAFEEILLTAITARYYGNQVGKILKPKRRRGAIPILTKSTERHVPKGVIGQISPWNYPLILGIADSLPGIAAGNALVAKPDSSTPFTSLLAFKLLFEAGLPRNVVQLVTGPGRVVGNTIAETCDFLMFTGSTATGKQLGEIAGRRLIGYSAELGGKNPMIITENANIDKIVDGVVTGCFGNSGQMCVSIERIYVHEKVYKEFVAKFAKTASSMKMGAGFDWSITMGSLTGGSQLATIEKYVNDAVNKGATVVAGAKARPELGPFFYEPTVLTNLSDDALLKREEVFGPVVYVEKVSSNEEAIEKANDTNYGLNSSVWGPTKEVKEIAKQLYSGTVSVNDGYAAAFASVENEMGGMKESGQGRRQGHYGMLKYTETQNITEQRFIPIHGPKFLTPRPYAAVMSLLMSVGKATGLLR